MKLRFDTTFKIQIEILPRLTYLYREIIAFEWLWFAIWIEFSEVNREHIESIPIEKQYIDENIFLNEIIPKILEIYKIDKKIWYNRSRGPRNITDISHMLMYLLYVEGIGGKRSLNEVGIVIRNRDHSSIVYGIKVFNTNFDTLPTYRREFYKLKHNLINIIKSCKNQQKDKKKFIWGKRLQNSQTL
jgi:hypothetical protein